ncbi:MAG: aminopeptidase P family protein [Eubacterium sp.]|nr:aminopeptidase P family protein [Eubacterium sp.]
MSKIQTIMKELLPHQAALVTSSVNRRYLTGFYSSAGAFLFTGENGYLLIDSRYYEKARKEAENCDVVLQNDLTSQFNELINKHSINKIFIESEKVTISELNDLIHRFPGVEFDSSNWLSKALMSARLIKSFEEIQRIETAQRIAETAFNKLLHKIREGLTEKQVAALLNYYLAGMGSDDISFPTIAASGSNSSIPHAVPTDKQLKRGEFLTLDFGAVYKGYHSDMTRTVCIGEPDEKMKSVYGAVLGANNDAMRALRDGVSGKLVDNIARSTLEAWGYEKYFGHGVGHGLGLEVHEAPGLSPKGEHTLKEGMVVTIEPGVYLPDEFGVRIEDIAVVTSDGCRVITTTQKSLIIL